MRTVKIGSWNPKFFRGENSKNMFETHHLDEIRRDVFYKAIFWDEGRVIVALIWPY